MTTSLRDRFFGCIAGVHIGSAMAAPVEGWSYQRIEETYGTLDRFLPYHHYRSTTDWVREPGTTEDGVERQKLIITAIIRKRDRITAEDLRAVWVSDMNPNGAGVISEPFEGPLLAMAKTPIAARDLGRYCDYAGLVSFARSCHPIGLINAGDVDHALEDILEVGQVYQASNSRGLQWAAVTGVGIAAATRPDATVDSVLDTIFDVCGTFGRRFVQDAHVVQELDRALELTHDCRDFRELRARFDEMYSGHGIPYAHSYANEVVTKAVCIFRMVRGNLKEAIIAGTNLGRDTDCATAVAAGLSGALTGSAGLPEEWVTQLDYATSVNPYTNSHRTLSESADGLYEVFTARVERLRTHADLMTVPGGRQHAVVPTVEPATRTAAPLPVLYGAHSYLFTDRWSDAGLGVLDLVKSLGIAVFEVAVGDDVHFDAALTRARAEAAGIKLTVGPGGEWPSSCDLSADDPSDRAAGLQWHKRQVDLAAELSAIAYVGALYGHSGVVRRRPPQPEELARTAEGLHALADYGEQRGVQIVLEPMSHFRTHLVNTPEQAMALIAAAAHDNLRVALDTYHLVTEVRDYGAAIRTVGNRLWGLHACESDRGVPGGGLVPWNAVFDALVGTNFAGCIMMESYNSSIGDPPGSFAHRRGMFHDPCPDGAAFVRRGLAFLKSGIEKRSKDED